MSSLLCCEFHSCSCFTLGASPVLNAVNLFLMAAWALIALVLLRRPSRDDDG